MTIDFSEDPRGVQLRLIIERAKYERHVIEQTSQLVERELNRVLDLMLSAKYRTLTKFQKQRAQQLYAELTRLIRSGYTDITEYQLKEMRGYAQVEAEVSKATAAGTLGEGSSIGVSIGLRLPKAYLTSIAKLPIQGLNLGEWFQAQANTMSLETRRIIQQGLVEGKGTTDIARRIVADARVQGPVLLRRARNEARAVTRTTVNAVQNDAAMASYQQLPASVSDSYRIVAVRDSRTTIICLNLDGRVYRYDDPDKMVPPFHIGCRTGTIPLLRGADDSLTAQKDRPLTMRSMTDWLKAQPNGVQNDLLGVTRANLFRDGKMSLADAVDGDTRVLTLPQLRERLGLEALK